MTAVGESIDTVREVRLWTGQGAGGGEPVDVHVRGGRIAAITPPGRLAPRGRTLSAEGAWAVPGLWDHHVHSSAWARRAERTDLSETSSAAEAASVMAQVAPGADGRRVGRGMRDGLWAQPPSLSVLDAATGAVPTYLVNADLHSMWLNSAALRREGQRSADGVLREHDAFTVGVRLEDQDASEVDRSVREAGRRAAGRGVVGIVDFDMTWGLDAWERRTASGPLFHRVDVSVYPVDLSRAIDLGWRTGALWGTGSQLRLGPLKIISDGSLGTRTAACFHPYAGTSDHRGSLTVDPEALQEWARRASAAGIDIAVHAIGDRAVASALDAFEATGAAGTIEHAQLVRPDDLSRFARLGVVASVQPRHALDDRELAAAHWRGQTSLAYPLASLQRAGVRLQFGSDAPVAPLDPWIAMAAAVSEHRGEEAAGGAERMGFADALRASIRSGFTRGEPADLVLCGADPHSDAAAREKMPVQVTLCDGRVTHTG